MTRLNSHSRMSATFLGAFILLALAEASARAALGQTVYIVGDNGQFGSIQLGTLVYTEITPNLGNSYRGLLYRPEDDKLYSVTRFVAGEPLRTISTTGTVTNVGNTGTDTAGLARRPSDGAIFYFDRASLRLGTIDPNTGTYTNIGSSILTNSIGDRIEFVGNNLFFIGQNAVSEPFNNGLYSLNQTTGAGTFIGSGGSVESRNAYTAMDATFMESNILYGIVSFGVGAHTLYSINTTTAVLTSLGDITGSNQPTFIRGAATIGATSASAPEPGTLSLLALGLLVPLVRRARR